tara:strand:- start:36 stop:1712 length:1677 start_codon:yes stop_codon:yes gene_type:complete
MSEKKYCRLCRKKETRGQCSYGPRLYDKYSVDDATEKETADAAVESGISENDIKNFSNIIIEKSKSGDSSLRDWFGKSKSSDGKPGWVQLGGKYSGKPCAKQPGQTTKPKCGSSKMKRNLSKDEEQAAFRRKNAEDPNPNRKGKAINVKTEETLHEGDYWHPDPEKDRKLGGPGANQRAREDRASSSSSSAKKKDDSKKLRPGESYMEYSKRQKGGSASVKPKKKSLLGKLGLRKEELEIDESHKNPESVKGIAKELDKAVEMHKSQAKRLRKSGVSEDYVDEACWKGYEKKGMKTMFGKRYPNCVKKTKKEEVELIVVDEGKKDACYHKVKSRYSVWPSAYASGALVKCRKKGAANWGNKTKKEEIELTDAYGETFAVVHDLIKPEPIQVVASAVDYDTYELEEATRVNAETGNLIHVMLTWKGRTYGMKMFFPQVRMPKRSEVQAELEKVYPGCRVTYFRIVEREPGETFLYVSEGAAWTKKSGKNQSGGLNEKGRKSYERENPGSDLKAPSKKVGNPRRASFCARMKGMKKKMTSSKTANDPDSRINKSLRAWNC